MDNSFTFSRASLAAFLACPRRFQLRYLAQMPWPVAPVDDQGEEARRLGQRFHQLLHRHFLGLPVAGEAAGDTRLHQWWRVFQAQGPALPAGRLFPEFSLTVPTGRRLLTGRFDLLVLGENSAHIFDWKTEARPRAPEALAEDLQTRLYLALLVEGSQALGQPVDPGQVSLTYWYVNEPAAAATINYGQEQHQRNWSWLQSLISNVEQFVATYDVLPLTNDLTECGRCAYPVYCDRQGVPGTLAEWEPEEEQLQLEPEWR